MGPQRKNKIEVYGAARGPRQKIHLWAGTHTILEPQSEPKISQSYPKDLKGPLKAIQSESKNSKSCPKGPQSEPQSLKKRYQEAHRSLRQQITEPLAL